jgi:diguanylate cyclase (GGDEF)-like protein
MQVTSLLSMLGQSISIIDAQGKVRFVVGNIEEIRDFSESHRVGTTPLDFVHPSDKRETISAFVEVLEGRVEVCQRTVRVIHRNGSVHPLLTTFRRTLHGVEQPEVNDHTVIVSAQLLPSERVETAELDAWSDPLVSARLQQTVEALRAVKRLPDPARTGKLATVLHSVLKTTNATGALIAVTSRHDDSLLHVLRIVSDRTDTNTRDAYKNGLTISTDRGSSSRTLSTWMNTAKVVDLQIDSPHLWQQVEPILPAEQTIAIPCDWGFAKGLVILATNGDTSPFAYLAGHITEAVAPGVAAWRFKASLSHEAEERYKTLLGLSTDLVIVVDEDDRVTYASPAAIRDLELDHPSAEQRIRPVLEKQFAAAFANTSVPGSIAEGEATLDLPSGEHCILRYTVTNLCHDKKVRGRLINATNIVQQRAAEKEQERSRDRHNAITSITAQLAESTPETVVANLKSPLKQLRELTNSSKAFLFLASEREHKISPIVVTDQQQDGRAEAPPLDTHPLTFAEIQTFASAGSRNRADLIADSSAVSHQQDLLNSSALTSLVHINGKTCGLVYLTRDPKHTYTTDEQHLADSIANTISSAVGRCVAQQRLANQAQRDSLTELGNRRQLSKRINDLMIQSINKPAEHGAALMFFDVDDFKIINDSLGHDVGDEVLKIIAKRLRRYAPDHATLARMGGDEFVVFIPELSSPGEATKIAHDVQKAVQQSMALRQHNVRPTIGGGLAFVSYGELAKLDTCPLLQRADLALVAAKQRGHGQLEMFDDQLAQSARLHIDRMSALDFAIEQKMFTLVYQPMFSASAPHQLQSIEALIRWRHNGVFVPPDEFIPLAERSGRIGAITEFVIGEGVRQLARWRRDGVVEEHVSISLNMSGNDLQSNRLTTLIKDALHCEELPPQNLHLELTETSAIDKATAIANLHRLKSLMIGIAIDDFGSGYASLSYLRDVPASVVKIDRSFTNNITDTRDRGLIAAAIAMGHQLDMLVVAEGVETQEQLDELYALGCDMVQGYHLCRPLPPSELVAWIRERTVHDDEARLSIV